MAHIFHYDIADVAPYINWAYFFHAWGLEHRFAAIADIHGCDSCRAAWLAGFPQADRTKAAEAMQLHKEAVRLLHILHNERRQAHAIVSIIPCGSVDDDIILVPEGTYGNGGQHIDGSSTFKLAFLRQQHPSKPDGPCLCMSDFVLPLSSGKLDTIGIFATAVDAAIEALYADDPYRHMLAQTVADRLAEATAEKLHQHVRQTLWGYAPDERLTVQEMHLERFVGIRPAVGYPSLPDQSFNFDIDAVLNLSKIGVTLTSTGAMIPHASVTGLMLAHPQSRYFDIGQIGEDQLADYARRRNKPVDTLRPFLEQQMT